MRGCAPSVSGPEPVNRWRERRRSRARPAALTALATSSIAGTKPRSYKWGNRGPGKGGGLSSPPSELEIARELHSQGTPASRLFPSSFHLRAKGALRWCFKPCHPTQFGKVFLPQTGAARTRVSRSLAQMRPHSHVHSLCSRRGGRA